VGLAFPRHGTPPRFNDPGDRNCPPTIPSLLRTGAHELFAEPGASQAVLDFLSSTDVGRTVPAVEEGGDAESEASEWELRERAEREEERRAEEHGVEDEGREEHRLFLPTPPFMAPAEAE